MTFQATEKDLESISEFSKQVHEKRKKRDVSRGDVGSHRLTRESVGKLGEAAAAYWYGGTVDYDLYADGKFQHSPDLPDAMNGSATVKTCSKQECDERGASWLVDKSDPIKRCPLQIVLRRIILVIADPLAGTAEVLGHVYPLDLIGKFVSARSEIVGRYKEAFLLKDIRGHGMIYRPKHFPSTVQTSSV